jgi:hypothetical protein
MEFACTRSFVGALVGRNAEVSYSHDERREHTKTDKDGHTHTSHSGSDRTTAYRTYTLTFYVEGKMREVTVGRTSASVPYVRADMAALQALNANTTEPAFYTYGQLQRQYLVKVKGWLFDGSVTEMTDLATIKTE